eukprot:12317801-Prorocentrum_lima.AAC.1
MVDVVPEQAAVLQQQLEHCHNSLASALQQTLEQAQTHMRVLLERAVQAALAELPSLVAAR